MPQKGDDHSFMLLEAFNWQYHSCGLLPQTPYFMHRIAFAAESFVMPVITFTLEVKDQGGAYTGVVS